MKNQLQKKKSANKYNMDPRRDLQGCKQIEKGKRVHADAAIRAKTGAAMEFELLNQRKMDMNNTTVLGFRAFGKEMFVFGVFQSHRQSEGSRQDRWPFFLLVFKTAPFPVLICNFEP